MTPELAQVCYNSIHAALWLGFGTIPVACLVVWVHFQFKRRRMNRDMEAK